MLKSLKKFNYFLLKRKKIFLIENEKDKIFLENSLIDEDYIAIDTEFNWRKTYFPELSLIQLSTSTKIFLIDFLKLKEISFLRKILESRKKKIIMHSARNDSTVLSTNLNINLKKSFDVQIAEKYINGGTVKNYAFIVSKYFGHKLSKSETNSNWLKRPLTQKQLEYAADDVNFLIPIFKKQLKILKKLKKDKIVYSESQKETLLGNEDLKESRVKKLGKISKNAKKIFIWREELAQSNNVPTSYIFKNNFLKKLCKFLDGNSHRSNIKYFFEDHAYYEKFLKDFCTK